VIGDAGAIPGAVAGLMRAQPITIAARSIISAQDVV
jgi:hypothetical protein